LAITELVTDSDLDEYGTGDTQNNESTTKQ
jgi:hypothetical protein